MINKIYKDLEQLNLLKNSPKYWWPNIGSFEVVIGAILTQNTTWKNVQKALDNLEGFLELDSFLTLDEERLKKFIKPSGFYNQKALRLKQLAKNIKDEFKTFENFKQNVTREWLLEQKGIGCESADSILCYACLRDEMVVDTYTKRLLKLYNIEFKKYSEYKYFLEDGLKNSDIGLSFKSCAIFHGMIVEINKNRNLLLSIKVKYEI